MKEFEKSDILCEVIPGVTAAFAASLKMNMEYTFGENIVIFDELSKEIHQQFNNFTGHVFIFSTGFAFKIIDPLLKSKTTDPTVVVMDDKVNHAISLISGHIGGANALTQKIAAIVRSVPVIITPTDTNNLPSIDMIAKDGNHYIENPQNIKYINMAFLKGEFVGLCDPLGIIKNRLSKVFWTVLNERNIAVEDTSMAKKQIFCLIGLKKFHVKL